MVNNMNYRRPMPRAEVRNKPSDANCAELMRAIMEADFFATDLKLYLDTHPNDERAIEMYREACKQYKACKAAFEDSFYPLNACSSGTDGCWDWLNGNWPPAAI
ncbi:MAG: spore coat protein CotJB [Oscillospiraceae bacterium]